jgi:hypothetical protein
MGGMRALALVTLIATIAGCTEARTSPPTPTHVAVTRPLGTFAGRGDQTIGVVSESGWLRVSWVTANEAPSGSGTFRLTLHSGVSGRPLELIADARGPGKGSREVADDPRPYNLMVESTNLDWSFSVEEIVAAPVPRRPGETP